MMKSVLLLMALIGFHACATAPNSGSESAEVAPKSKSQFNIPGQHWPGADNCTEGQVRTGYLQPTTSGDFACPEGTQTCTNGQWIGPMLHQSCENHTKSCDGSWHGTTKQGYLQPTTFKGMPCPTATVTCMNGQWVGPHLYDTCAEL